MSKRKLSQMWSFIRRLDFSEVQKDIADDLKKGSYAMWTLWLLSSLSKLPAPVSVMLKGVGVDAQAIQVSPWVSWLLLVAAVTLWVVQTILRVKVRERQSRNIGSTSPGTKRTSRPDESKENEPRRYDDVAARVRDSGVLRQKNRPRQKADKTTAG